MRSLISAPDVEHLANSKEKKEEEEEGSNLEMNLPLALKVLIMTL
jgi:hypothetical protein